MALGDQWQGFFLCVCVCALFSFPAQKACVAMFDSIYRTLTEDESNVTVSSEHFSKSSATNSLWQVRVTLDPNTQNVQMNVVY